MIIIEYPEDGVVNIRRDEILVATISDDQADTEGHPLSMTDIAAAVAARVALSCGHDWEIR